jgi:xanthine permease XanP
MKTTQELIYGLNDRPPLRETLFAALQHLLDLYQIYFTSF